MKTFNSQLKKWLEKPETKFYKSGDGSHPLNIDNNITILCCQHTMQEDGKTYMNGYNSKFLATVELSEKVNGKDLSSIQGDIEVYANVKNDQIVSIDGGHISLHKR